MADTTPEPAGRKPGQRYDWATIKAEYVEGIPDPDTGDLTWPTMATVAERNNGRPDYIRAVAAEEGWKSQRAAYQRRLEATRQDERSRVLAKDGAELDSAALRIARTGLGVIGQRMAELGAQAAERAKAISAQTSHTELPDGPNHSEIGDLAKSAQAFHRLGKEAIGEIPAATLHIGVEGAIDVHQRTHRTELIVAALIEADVLPPGVGLALTGRAAAELGAADDTTDEQVHSE